MADKAKSEDKSNIDPNMLNMMRDLQSAGFGSAAMMGTAWVEAMSDLGSEFLSFVADRVKEDVQTQHQILHAKDINDLQAIQADFVQKAIEQYSAESGKIVELSQSVIAKIPGALGKDN